VPGGGDRLQRLLLAGCRRLEVDPGPDGTARLADYAREAARWGQRINLTGRPDPARFARDHILDAVAALPHLGIRPGGAWADVGAGVGIPGVPLAVLAPGARWTLVEPRERRWAFLVHVTHLLGLAGVTVVRARAEAAPIAPGSLDGIVSRAVGDLALACHGWLRAAGRVWVWAGPDRARWPRVPGGSPLTALPPVRTGRTEREVYLLGFAKGGAGAP
jgi:16S rRNA (guanine527-N7)-methyltransferase